MKMGNSPTHTLAEIIDSSWPKIIGDQRYNAYQIRQLNAIKSCRTAALGGELYVCKDCGKHHKRYYSCRNRNCPTSQRTQANQWMDRRMDELLPVQYFHSVFTIPDELNEWFITYPRQMYKLLFDASWYTIETLGWDHKYLGVQMGAIGILHTWGQNLSLHPHIHYIVPGGGVDIRGKWRTIKSKGKYLFPVKVMMMVFRARFVKLWKEGIAKEGMEIEPEDVRSLKTKPWVVYCKPPFGGSKGALEYIGRYVFKTAISNHRIVSVTEEEVIFRYKDYRNGGRKKTMKLSKTEFIRRFCLHLLPKRMVRIRHYGILSGRNKRKFFDLPIPDQPKDYVTYWKEKGVDLLLCQQCKNGRLIFIQEIPKRGPPLNSNSKPKIQKHI